MRSMLRSLFRSGAAFALAAVSAAALEVGDPAPPLKGVKQWLNGAAVEPSAGGEKTLHVIEFWATWCGPCRTTVPHLNDLHEKLKDRGVVFVGVTEEDEATVRRLTEKIPIRYRIALDTERTTAETWMKEVEGIPHAFIVGADGKIAWAGHPMDGLDEALEAMLDGTFDPEKARRRSEQEQQLMQALQAGDLTGAATALDKLLEADPLNMELAQMKAGLLFQAGNLEGLKAHYRALLRAFHDSAEKLNELAWMQVAPSPMPLHARDLGVAWAAARRAVELSERKDAAILDTLALVLFQLGLTDAAIATQEEALARAADEETREQIRRPLEFFKAAKALAEEVVRTLDAEAPAR